MLSRSKEPNPTTTSTARAGGRPWPTAALAAALVLAGCSGGSGASSDTDGPSSDGPPSDDPCAAFTECVACGDARTPDGLRGLGCAWCAGSCVSPPDDASVSDGSWCEWGFAGGGTQCKEQDGVRIVETTLPIDCRASINFEDPRCAEPDDDNAGEVGEGPVIPGGLAGLYGGFIDIERNLIVLGVEQNRSGDELGSIFTVDLATGARALASGMVEDALVGSLERGTGPELGTFVMDIERAPDGDWIAYASGGLFRVDPDTGDRTLIYSFLDTTCAHAGIAFRPGYTDGSSIAVGPDGTIYAPIIEDVDIDPPLDTGVFAISPEGECSVLSLSSSESDRVVGEGPYINGINHGLLLQGDELLVVAYPGRIYAVDVATGDRRFISSEVESVGDGPPADYQFIALSGTGAIWTSGDSTDSFGDATRAMTEIDPATGDRKLLWTYLGPATSTGDIDWAAPHPDLPGIVVAVTNRDAIVLYEPASGNTNLLSH